MLVAVSTILLATPPADAKPKPDKPRSQPAIFHGHRKGNQAWQWNWQVWLPDKWRRIGVCETGLRWDWNSGTYQGSFGFAVSSWDQFKPVAWWPSEAYLATPWMQYRTALAIHARYGFSGWGCRNA